jgi:hypothetical protein
MRTIVALACALAALAGPAAAAEPQVVDPAGDANYVNDNMHGYLHPGTATPVSLDERDILSIG